MYTVTPKQRKDGRWHWSAVARNGKIVFSGAEGDGFASKRGAVDNFWRVVNNVHFNRVRLKT